VVVYSQDGLDGELTLDEVQRPPAFCPRCGRHAQVLEVLVVYGSDSYANADRLAITQSGT
jgi:hypothetical protein